MYDTHLGQFLNADPIILDEQNSQNYALYSYVLNNPLKYTDPSGYTQQGGPASAAIVGQTGNMLQTQLLEMNNNINAIKEGAEQPFFLVSDLMNDDNNASGNVSSGDGPKKPDPSQSKGPVSSGSKASSFQYKGITYTFYQVDFGGSGGAQGSGGDWANALGVGLGIGELARQGKVYEIYGRSAETVENALKNGQYVHTNGKTYSQGFRGNQYISSKTVSNSLSTAKFARNLGRGMTGAGLALSGYQLLSSQGTGADYARFTGSLIITGTAAIPIAGPFISIGLGFADSFGAFDPIYNYFGK